MSDPLARVLGDAADRLARAEVPSPRVDAELLAAHTLGVGRGELAALAIRGEPFPSRELAVFEELIRQRAERVPLQHLTGRAPFRRLELAVGPGVFIPRPETELLAGWAIEAAAAAGSTPLVVDLCTGSGAIALAVADEVAGARVVAVEREPAALVWARRNLENSPDDVRARVELRRGDVTHPLADSDGALADLAGRVDVVVANPPYIPQDAVPVEVEVARYDPPAALFGGGDDGLSTPRGVVALAAVLLRSGGALLMEHADVQGRSTRALLDETWEHVGTRVDLGGRDRVLSARRVS